MLPAIHPARPTLSHVPLADPSFRNVASDKILIEELEHAPESVQRDVFALLRYVRVRSAGSEGRAAVHALLPLAESVWAADWDIPGEDEAWRSV